MNNTFQIKAYNKGGDVIFNCEGSTVAICLLELKIWAINKVRSLYMEGVYKTLEEANKAVNAFFSHPSNMRPTVEVELTQLDTGKKMILGEGYTQIRGNVFTDKEYSL